MRFRHASICAATVGLLLSTAGFAQSFVGTVVKVKDGDSIVVDRSDVKRKSEVRLTGIDAPELSQPHGIQARTALRRLIQGKQVRVEQTDRDRYGRIVGKVFVGRSYVNEAMVRSGNAWSFDRYFHDARIQQAEIAARADGRGFWALPEAERQVPSEWRKAQKRKI